MGSFLNSGPFGVPFRRVPCYMGDLKRDPNLEHYPHTSIHNSIKALRIKVLCGAAVDRSRAHDSRLNVASG